MIPDFPSFHRMFLAVRSRDDMAGWWLGRTATFAELGNHAEASRVLGIATAPYFAQSWDR